jgi:uncharacterized oligopeptide transporter (OPT) family protein
MTRTFLVVGIALLVFFLLKRPAYASNAENFEVTGGEVVRYIGAAALGIFAVWSLYILIGWLISSRTVGRFNSYARPTYYTPAGGGEYV